MKQFCLCPLTPKICLLILSSNCYTFPCTFVSLKGRMDTNRKLFEWQKCTDDKQKPFQQMSQYFEWMLMYFEHYNMQTVQHFVEHFEQIFLGVQMDDEQIMNGLPVQMDNH